MKYVHKERIRRLNKHTYAGGPILYWMDREMRARDNWALLRALELGKTHNQPVGIVYNLVPDYLGGRLRQFAFKTAALKELEHTCREKRIPFFVLTTSDTKNDLVAWIKKMQPGYIVTDMNPLRINRRWKKHVSITANIPFEEVDAHNIIPVWTTSQKQEFAARTIRPKIHARLDEFLEPFPRIYPQKHTWRSFPKTDWREIHVMEKHLAGIRIDWITSGQKAAHRMLRNFIANRLRGYAIRRNDPTQNALSNLSPYFHYGMLAPARAVLEVLKSKAPRADKDVFIEEAVVRRELSDNFCFYNSDYDSIKGFATWAQTSLNKHRNDKREYVYTKTQFEHSQTHDPLWNAANNQMVQTGKMHGYMRMYWAKKILEWTNTPEQAMRIAIYLNDTYELDGRDPNGYVGIAWSIGGVHDRAWFERPIYGKIRYMNANGCKRKFDVDAYIARWA